MRWAAIVLGLATGCFDPSVQPGAPCASNGACPGSLVCVDGYCERAGGADPDAPIDSAVVDAAPDADIDAMIDAMTTPADTDGDGVANMQDNCAAMANADQHDEDNDSIGDVCDNCPHVANANQANAMDNDSVGDVCDPNPTLGGDSIARFLPMHVVPPMVTTSGGWSIVGDAYVHGNNMDASLIVQGGPWTNTTIVISGAQLANIVPFVWIAATVGESAGGYYHCGYEDENDGAPDYHRGVWGYGLNFDWEFYDAYDHFNAARLMGPFTIQLHGNAMADEIDCTMTDTRGTVSTGTLPADSLAPGNAGIRSEGISYQVNYIVVFKR